MSTLYEADGQSSSLFRYNTNRELGLITHQLNTLAEKRSTRLQFCAHFPSRFKRISELKNFDFSFYFISLYILYARKHPSAKAAFLLTFLLFLKDNRNFSSKITVKSRL